ncbi:ABC transporter substrate-binding protein [Scatolibacter rhodanostii]|uniref:ABC transporter substrate-binding protein n=1 Tax=Scatolibacter rhodanostii TaxID=2014781 RepID=UPI000C06970D|nr:ABC transporter substrate-binding protein [Scatolibacter rhodanostii]
MKKLSFILVFATLFTLVLTACSPSAQESKASTPESEKPSSQAETVSSDTTTEEVKELRWGSTTEPVTLDPLNAGNSADGRSILFNVFEGLVKPDTDGNLQPALAESYQVEEGGLKYTFPIRTGVKFHNGATLTAEDVVYSLEIAKEQGFTGLDQIDTIIADGNTVVITLTAPDTYFLPFLTVGVVPKDYTDRENKPIGTGPFSLESYTPQQNIVLVKNKDYWNTELPKLDKVTIQFVSDTNALLTAVQGGNIDGASIIDYSQLQQLDANEYSYIESQSASVQLLALNNSYGPLADVKVRQAISYAVDKTEIIDTAFYGFGTPSGTPIIPGLKTYFNSEVTDAYQADIDKAKQLLTEAGYGDGFDLEITVSSNYTMHLDTAQVIINQLAKIGVNATIAQVDWATWLEQVYSGRQYQSTIISIDGNLAPSSFLSRYRSDAKNNFINFSNAEFDTQFDIGSATLEESERIEAYNKAQQILSDNAASVYIQDINSFNVLRKDFSGAVDYPLYVFDFSTITKN